MARMNIGTSATVNRTHEGAPAKTLTRLQELRRSVLACMLWEDNFYSSGASTAERIAALVPQCKPEDVAALAIEARSQMYLRHVPLFLVREMVRHEKHRKLVRKTLATVIQRADEMSEFLAMYWGGGDRRTAKDKALPKSVQRGLADAFVKFSPYQLAKYNRDNPIKLRDVLFLSHAKPQGAIQASTWAKLVDGTLESPDTWEVAITACGKDEAKKQAEWMRLLSERKLGGMALMRNLRNMQQCKVRDSLIREALVEMKPDKILPFRFLSALRYAPSFASELESAMLKNLAEQPRFDGMTVVVVDCSASMDVPVSKKSEVTRNDAAIGVAIAARELSDSCRVFAYGTYTKEMAAYRGLALLNELKRSNVGSSTNLGQCIRQINRSVEYDRIIVITDEQSHDAVPGPNGKGYVINVAVEAPGVGYGAWQHIDGWSDRVLDFIRVAEAEAAESE